MGVPFTAYDAVGIKEDISDVITNISPTDTPFISMIGTEKVHNTLYQWQEDELALPNLNNALVQGADATAAPSVPTYMRQNYTQILGKTLQVAETTDATARYGRAKETAYQLGKYSKEVKRDLEAIATSSQASASGNNTTAANFAGYGAMIFNGTDPMSYAENYASNVVKTGGSSTPMSETNLITALQQLFILGVDPSMVLIPPAEALNIASFASATGRTRYIENDVAEGKRIVNAVDVYVSPFGEVKIALDRFSPTTDHLIFDPTYWKLAVLRPWFRQTLAKMGDSTKMQIIGEFGLIHKNFRASAIVRKSA